MIIDFRDVSKGYESFRVLTDINVAFHKMDRIVIRVASCSIKSAQIRCFNRLEAHQLEGCVVDGFTPYNMMPNVASFRKKVGLRL